MSDLASLFNKYQKPSIKLSYGTAGFRFKADLLPSTMFRSAILASLRSQKLDGKTIGIMITASHNPPQDNGVKLVDPYGEMLDSCWEKYATQLANAESLEEFENLVNSLISKRNIDTSIPAKVIYAMDSRESSPSLAKAVADGLDAVGANATNYGLLTTPQLHYLVRCLNTENTPNAYGVPTEDGYYQKLAAAYKNICLDFGTVEGQKPIEITVDAANGVGGPKLDKLAALLDSLVTFTIVNNNYTEPNLLNSNCGADFVKVNQKLPGGIQSPHKDKLYCSFDGDADRIMFFYLDNKGLFKLLDGDKIATLAAGFLKDISESANADIRLGVVQTAYANGSSTEYLTKNLKVPVECTPTGVKHLHHVAQTFDIGAYFEANGHGTVLFDPVAVARLQQLEVHSPAQKTAVDTLLAFSELINQAVGDAISDLLMVLAILSLTKWSAAEWDQCYTDLPNGLRKVEVKDRSIFQTTDAERKLVSPAGLQAQINAIVDKYSHGRSFVRASGTENVVRIYAEAQTKGECDELSNSVAKLLDIYK